MFIDSIITVLVAVVVSGLAADIALFISDTRTARHRFL